VDWRELRCRSGPSRRIGRHARILARRGTFDRLDDRLARSSKRVQATFELLLEQLPDELFPPTLLALSLLA
jgi:hypothetical protein